MARASMEPLSALPREVLRDVPGVVFDVDDTLTRGGVIEVEALAALHRLRGWGLQVALLTGRPIGWAETLAALLPVSLAVGENGAGWAFIEGRSLRRGRFEPDAERGPREAKQAALAARIATQLPWAQPASDSALRVCDLAFDVGESFRASPEQVTALRTSAQAAGAQVTVSSVHLHAHFGGWDKASGVARAVERVLGVAPLELFSRWIFVGDSGNDAPAFARFERTVGVANVKDHLASLSVPPRWVTTADRGRGVAELVEAIGEARA